MFQACLHFLFQHQYRSHPPIHSCRDPYIYQRKGIVFDPKKKKKEKEKKKAGRQAKKHATTSQVKASPKEKGKGKTPTTSHLYITSLPILMTLRSSIRPPGQPVRNITHIATRRARRRAQIPIHRLDAAVVAARGFVGVRVVVQVLHQAVAVARALHAVLDHVPDGLVGVLGVVLDAFVRLHYAGVVDAGVGFGCADFGAAVGLVEGGLLVWGDFDSLEMMRLTSWRMVARMKRWSTRETLARYWIAL